MSEPDDNTTQTPPSGRGFDFSAYPPDTLFHDRRSGLDRRAVTTAPEPPTEVAGSERRRTDRRKRIDPTTFEKQYTVDELEFMNAMQEFKVRHAKSFPSYGDVLRVAFGLGYRREVDPDAGVEALERDQD